MNQKRRSKSLKAEDENDLYHLLMHVSKELKRKFKLKNTKVQDSTLELRHQFRSYGWRQSIGIDYDDISVCCAYLERYATCHAALTKQATEWFLLKMASKKIQQSLFQRESLKVVDIGGGPGNDLLGFCSAIEGTTRTFKDLELSVVDLKSGWRDAFEETMSAARSLAFGKAGNLLEDDDVQVTLKFLPADLTCEMMDEIREADLILMVKVLSNVPGSSRSKMLKNIFSSLKGGAVVLYVDTLASKVEHQANQPYNNMDVLFTKKRHRFNLSIDKKERRNMVTDSNYEICVLQKLFNSDLDAGIFSPISSYGREDIGVANSTADGEANDDDEEASDDDEEASDDDEEASDDDEEEIRDDDETSADDETSDGDDETSDEYDVTSDEDDETSDEDDETSDEDDETSDEDDETSEEDDETSDEDDETSDEDDETSDDESDD